MAAANGTGNVPPSPGNYNRPKPWGEPPTSGPAPHSYHLNHLVAAKYDEDFPLRKTGKYDCVTLFGHFLFPHVEFSVLITITLTFPRMYIAKFRDVCLNHCLPETFFFFFSCVVFV